MSTPETQWRGDFTNAELNALHAEGFGPPAPGTPGTTDWLTQLHRHSLGWVTARSGPALLGFVNVAWDGGTHAFLLDTVVAAPARRTGLGTLLVATAATAAREAGCAWLHVDYEPHLRDFYLTACGFRPTDAGLLRLC